MIEKEELHLESNVDFEPAIHCTFDEVVDKNGGIAPSDSNTWIQHIEGLCEDFMRYVGELESLECLMDDYLIIGQEAFFAEFANIAAENGFPVYDGDTFFEIYHREDALAILSEKEELRLNFAPE